MLKEFSIDLVQNHERIAERFSLLTKFLRANLDLGHFATSSSHQIKIRKEMHNNNSYQRNKSTSIMVISAMYL